MHSLATEGHEAVPAAYVLDAAKGFIQHLQRLQPRVPVHCELVADLLYDLLHQRDHRRVAAQVKLLRGQTEDRPGERVPAVGVPHQVRLVDDGDVHHTSRIRHLHRARHVPGAAHRLLLLPRDHVARHAVFVVEPLGHLPREQPQGRAVHAALGRLEALDGGVGLAAVGGSDVEVDLASHAPRERIPLPGLAHVHQHLHRILIGYRRGASCDARFVIGRGFIEARRRRRVVPTAGGHHRLADRRDELRLLRRPLEPLRPGARGVEDLLQLHHRELLGIRGGRRPRSERAPSHSPRTPLLL